MLYVSIAFFLALVPIITKAGIGDGIRTPKEIASIIGFIVIIIAGLDCIKKPFKGKILFFFLGWGFITTLYALKVPLFFEYDAQGIALSMPGELFAWKELFYILLSVLTIYAIATPVSLSPIKNYRLGNLTFKFKLSSYKDEIRSFATLINWLVIFMCGYSIIQAFGADDFFRVISSFGVQGETSTSLAFTHRVVGTIGNPSLFAEWLAMCLPFSLYVGGKKGWIGTILIIIALGLTQSASSIVAAGIAVAFYLFFRYKIMRKIIPLIIALILVVAFFNKGVIKEQFSNGGSFLNPTGRIEVHKQAWEVLKKRPLIGVGLGSFENIIGLNPAVIDKLKNNWRELHDDIGQIWFSTGLIGLAIFLGFVLKTFWGFLKKLSNETIVLASSMVAFLAISLVMFPMRVAPHSFYGVVVVGLLLRGI